MSLEEFSEFVGANQAWVSISILGLLLVWESVSPFFPFFRQQFKRRVIHAVLNLAIQFLNSAMIAFVFVGLWVWATEFAVARGFGLLHLVQWPKWAEVLAAVLLLDFFTYWWHRINHVVPFFWRFHRMHHSDPAMDVTTANRFHIGEIAMSSILRIPVLILIGAEIWHLTIYAAAMFPIVQFHHANVAVPPWLDRLLRLFIVTPAMHKIHHSREQPETDSNYTSLLSIWDRIFGSFRMRSDLDQVRIGLDGYDNASKQSLTGMLGTPFRD